jgi:sugar-specific transcriptional regulator TrmB
MITLSFTKEITETGLSKEQAVVYEALLRSGSLPASKLTKAIPAGEHLSRPLVYKILDDLIVLELVEKTDEQGKVAIFTPKHPTSLAKVLEERKAALEKVKKQFVTVAGSLSSLYNLSVGKPGVQMYEGKDGIWEVLLDSLTATEEILTYADLEAIDSHIPDLNAEYSTLREEKDIKKRGLVIDSPQARSFLKSYDGKVTHTKLIASSESFVPFQTVMQIYDNKVSYITLSQNHLIGMIITNEHIAKTHKFLFESHWKLSSGEEV